MCYQRNLPFTTANKRSVADMLVPHIRFPVMEGQDFFRDVATQHEGFLTDQELAEVFLSIDAKNNSK